MMKNLSGGEKRKEGHSRQREEPVVFKPETGMAWQAFSMEVEPNLDFER